MIISKGVMNIGIGGGRLKKGGGNDKCYVRLPSSYRLSFGMLYIITKTFK
jgi:hypothetical protein